LTRLPAASGYPVNTYLRVLRREPVAAPPATVRPLDELRDLFAQDDSLQLPEDGIWASRRNKPGPEAGAPSPSPSPSPSRSTTPIVSARGSLPSTPSVSAWMVIRMQARHE